MESLEGQCEVFLGADGQISDNIGIAGLSVSTLNFQMLKSSDNIDLLQEAVDQCLGSAKSASSVSVQASSLLVSAVEGFLKVQIEAEPLAWKPLMRRSIPRC